MPRPATRRTSRRGETGVSRRKSSKAAAVDVSTILEESSGDFRSSTPIKNNKQQQVEDPFGFFQVSNVKAEKPSSPAKKPTPVEDDNENKENEAPSDNELSIVTPLNSSQPSSPQKSPHKPPPNRTPLRQLNGRELLERMPKRRHVYREDFSSSPEKEPTPRPKRKRAKKQRQSREPTPDEVSQEIDYERINEIKSRFNQIDEFVLDEEEVSPYSSQ